VAAAITFAPFSDGLPRTFPPSPRSQITAPVAGSTRRSDPSNAPPPMVVALPPMNSRPPSQIAAGRQADPPEEVDSPTRSVHTGPAAMLAARSA
jgi:hypothetical protein